MSLAHMLLSTLLEYLPEKAELCFIQNIHHREAVCTGPSRFYSRLLRQRQCGLWVRRLCLGFGSQSSNSVITIIALGLEKIRWTSSLHLCKQFDYFLCALGMTL